MRLKKKNQSEDGLHLLLIRYLDAADTLGSDTLADANDNSKEHILLFVIMFPSIWIYSFVQLLSLWALI